MLPAPPTDHLSKFMAVLGLLMIIIGIGYPVQQQNKLKLELNELVTEHQVAIDRATYFIEAAERYMTSPSVTREGMEDLYKSKAAHLEAVTVRQGKISRIRLLSDEVDRAIGMGILLIGLGLPISAFGFVRWYKLQRAIDLKTFEQAQASRPSKRRSRKKES